MLCSVWHGVCVCISVCVYLCVRAYVRVTFGLGDGAKQSFLPSLRAGESIVLLPIPSQSHCVANGLCTTVHARSVTLCGLLLLYYRPCPVSHTMWPMASVLPSIPSQSHCVAYCFCTTVHAQSVTPCGQWPVYYRQLNFVACGPLTTPLAKSHRVAWWYSPCPVMV